MHYFFEFLYYDDQLVGKYIPKDLNNNDVWPFDEDSYIIMNLAVEREFWRKYSVDLNEEVT